MADGKFISYLRVSTDKQGRSGLGIEAQRKAVTDFLNGGNWQLIEEFEEHESGKRNDRPALAAVLEACRKQKATLVIAKLDRLSRNVHFLSGLLESRVDFVCSDMPEADRAFLQMAAVFAEWEARKISERTSAALQAAKARGRLLGYRNPQRAAKQAVDCRKGASMNKARAARFAGNTLPIVESIRKAGITSLRGIADTMNTRGIRTPRGGKWYASSVRNLIARDAHEQHPAH